MVFARLLDGGGAATEKLAVYFLTLFFNNDFYISLLTRSEEHLNRQCNRKRIRTLFQRPHFWPYFLTLGR